MLLSLGSCETVDFGDTNENPNGALELNTGALLSAAQVRFTAGVGFRNWLANPHHYVQYQAQPSYADPSRYAEAPVDWSAYYSETVWTAIGSSETAGGPLMNLQQIINLSQDEDVISQPAYTSNGSVNNQVAVAKIMKVLIFKRLTDTYGDIPYFEALNPEIQSPAYTPQQEIYADFINELQEARDMLNPAELGAQGDVIYGGDVEAWGRFANSLLLSVAIQLSETEMAATAATVFQSALNNEYGVIETVPQEAWYMPLNASSVVNPWTGLRPADYNMAEYFQDALQGDAEDYSNDTFDERLMIYSTHPEEQGLEYGLPEGEAEGTPAKISLYVTSPTSPFPILTSAYTYLNRAEAAELGWTSEDAEAMLQEGIVQSYISTSEMFGTGPHVAASGLEPMIIVEYAEEFAASRLEDAAETGILQVIGEEKWAALFPQGFLAWSEWRRTGWPNLTPSPAPLNDGAIPTRYLYPVNEQNLNNANYQEAVSNLSPGEDKNTARVWWDQNPD